MIDIVIVNWNSGNLLAKCVGSIFTKKNNPLVNKIIIVDNHSSDESATQINKDEKITILVNDENAGFSKACNQGFRLCTSPYVLLLNPDAAVMETTLADCIAFMNANSAIQILGCKLLNDAGVKTASCSRFPSPVRIFYDATGLSKIAPRLFNPATLMTDWDHNDSREVDLVMGAFMVIRKKLFEQIGFFDEQFFVYYEEVDFSKRLALSGGRTFYNKDIVAIHSGEGTTQSVKAFRLFLSLYSRLQYAKKYFKSGGYLLVWVSTFFIEPFTRMFFHLVRGDTRAIGEVLKGIMMLIKKTPGKHE